MNRRYGILVEGKDAMDVVGHDYEFVYGHVRVMNWNHLPCSMRMSSHLR